MTWRDHARPIIATVIAENAGKPESEVRAALKKAYPYGLREHHPYKIWLDEVARQLGQNQRGRKRRPIGSPKPVPPDPRQVRLFEGE